MVFPKTVRTDIVPPAELIEVRSDETVEIAFGRPALTVTAIEESKRWNPDAKPATEFMAGDALYISRKLGGVSKETYGRFNRVLESEGMETRYDEIEPKLRILDADNNEVIKKTLEYG